jgi:hypothetical protein
MSRNNDAEIFDLVAKVVASKYSAYQHHKKRKPIDHTINKLPYSPSFI